MGARLNTFNDMCGAFQDVFQYIQESFHEFSDICGAFQGVFKYIQESFHQLSVIRK